MNGDRTPADHAKAGDPLHRKVAGMIRRIVVEFSSTGPFSRPVLGIWQLRGFRELKEVVKAEVFQGIGIWARPPAAASPAEIGNVEAVAVSVGDSDHQVVIAMRDEPTRQKIAPKVAPNETLLHNTLVGVHCKADGTIHAETHAGTAVPLATLADLRALRKWIEVHVHGVVVGEPYTSPPAVTPPGAPVPTETGTTVLRGE